MNYQINRVSQLTKKLFPAQIGQNNTLFEHLLDVIANYHSVQNQTNQMNYAGKNHQDQNWLFFSETKVRQKRKSKT